MKSDINPADEILVIDEHHALYGRIRIDEGQGSQYARRASIFLTPTQLEQHAQECLALVAKMRARR